MALEATFRDLYTQLRRLQDTLVALRVTVAEDKPLKGEAALVDYWEDTILELMGSLHECLTAAGVAQEAVGHPTSLERARRALTTCQEQFHQAEKQFSADLVSYEKLKALASLASERRGEWRPWVNSVRHGLEQCRSPLDLANKALAGCWQEIAERVGMTSVSMEATNIGQQITAAPSDLGGFEKQRVT
jgi:hypothetical protein